jgi:hypothetical protein
LVMVNDLSDMLLDLICHYFVDYFYIDFHYGDLLVVLLFVCVLVWFWVKCNAAFIE